MSGRRGSATIERLPRARGPELHASLEPADDVTGGNSICHPGDSWASSRSARPSEPRRGEHAGALRSVVRGARSRAPSRNRAAARALVPDVESGANGDPGVAGGRLDEDLFEWRLRPDRTVRDCVQRDPARQARCSGCRSVPRAARPGAGRPPRDGPAATLRRPRAAQCSAEKTSCKPPRRRWPKTGSWSGHVHSFLVVPEEVEPELNRSAPFSWTTARISSRKHGVRLRARPITLPSSP